MFVRRLPTVLAVLAASVIPAAAAQADAPWSPPAALPAGAQSGIPVGAMTLDGHAGVVVPNTADAARTSGAAAQLLRLDTGGAVLATTPLGIADAHVTTGTRDQLVIAGSSLGTRFPGTIDDTSHIRVATATGAGGTGTTAAVHGSTGLHVDAVAADPAGDIVLVGANTTKRVVYLRSARQRDFHAVLTIKVTNRARGATVAVGPKGDVLVVWEDSHVIRARHRGAKGTWGAVHTLGPGVQSDLQAAIDASGRELVAWKSQRVNEGESNTPAIVSFITAAPGHGWGTRRQIASVGASGIAGRLVAAPGVELDVADAHHTLLTWTGFDGTNYVVRAMTVTDGHTGPAQTLSPAGTDAVLGDATVAAGNGPALVLWRTGVRGADPVGPDARPRLFASTRAAGATTFSAPEAVSTPDASTSQPPVAMVAGASGTALAAFGVLSAPAQVSARGPIGS
jgi:hypothetical protein